MSEKKNEEVLWTQELASEVIEEVLGSLCGP